MQSETIKCQKLICCYSKMCLLIGPTSSGKTLIVKTLQAGNYHTSKCSNQQVPATVPTTGTNLVNIVVHKKKEVVVRELGGSMGPIWKNYFKDSSVILYVIDASNRCQVAATCVQLLAVLSHPLTSATPVLVLLNKQDMPCVMSQSELEWLLRLDDIQKHARQKLTVMEVSARTGQGLEQVARWIHDNHRDPASATQWHS